MMDVAKLEEWSDRIRTGFREKTDTKEETDMRLKFFNAQALLEIAKKLDKPKGSSQ